MEWIDMQMLSVLCSANTPLDVGTPNHPHYMVFPLVGIGPFSTIQEGVWGIHMPPSHSR
jgi:hypothetical protein